MAGTWKLTGFTNIRYTDAGTYWWSNLPNTGPELVNQPMGSGDGVWGKIAVALSTGQLYLDGAVTPTAYADLPEDFGIDSITYEDTPPWIKDGVNPFTPNFPVTSDDGNSHVLRGGAAAYYWTIEPIGLQEYQTNTGVNASVLTLADPYLGAGYPPVLTKWNGFLNVLLTQGTFQITFSQMSAAFGAYLLYVFTQFATVDANGVATSNSWEINGTYDSFPPPPNPTINPLGGLSFGGAPVIQALTDASGIYTLVPGQYHDELYQRTSTTTSTTISVMIPAPFFKTGFIGGN
jgi:hypothetical protein